MRLFFHVLGALVGLALVAGTAKAILDVAARDSFDVNASYSGITNLVVDQQSGSVRIVGVPGGRELRVRAHVKRGLDEPTRRAIRRGGSLALSASCGSVASDHCGVDYSIRVPAGTTVSVSSGAGPIEVDGLATPSAKLESGAGPVLASNVKATRLSATSSAGPVEVSVARPARLLRAKSSAGPVSLRVPDVPYAVDISSAAGGVFADGLRRDASSRYSISAESSAGPVRVDVTP